MGTGDFSHVSRIAAIEEECRGVWGVSGISSWERDRLEEWKSVAVLSTKQERILREIEAKAFRAPRDR